jgi:hypothetical protein
VIRVTRGRRWLSQPRRSTDTLPLLTLFFLDFGYGQYLIYPHIFRNSLTTPLYHTILPPTKINTDRVTEAWKGVDSSICNIKTFCQPFNYTLVESTLARKIEQSLSEESTTDYLFVAASIECLDVAEQSHATPLLNEVRG